MVGVGVGVCVGVSVAVGVVVLVAVGVLVAVWALGVPVVVTVRVAVTAGVAVAVRVIAGVRVTVGTPGVGVRVIVGVGVRVGVQVGVAVAVAVLAALFPCTCSAITGQPPGGARIVCTGFGMGVGDGVPDAGPAALPVAVGVRVAVAVAVGVQVGVAVAVAVGVAVPATRVEVAVVVRVGVAVLMGPQANEEWFAPGPPPGLVGPVGPFGDAPGAGFFVVNVGGMVTVTVRLPTSLLAKIATDRVPTGSSTVPCVGTRVLPSAICLAFTTCQLTAIWPCSGRTLTMATRGR